MKESMFNIYLVDEKEQKYLVFNTLSKSLVQIDGEVYTLMTQKRLDEMDDTGLRALRKERIIVGDSVNELDMLRIIINRGRFDGTSVGVTVIPTHACNLACIYCYQGHGDVLSTTMSEETVRRTIEFIKKIAAGRRKIELNFYGGEPLLFPDKLFRILEEIHTFAEQQGAELFVYITSNGILFTEDIMNQLSQYNHKVQITLCGPKEVHNTIRVDKQGNGTYDALMTLISLFKKHGITFQLRVDVGEDNVSTIGALLDDLNRRGFGGAYIRVGRINKDYCYQQVESTTAELKPSELVRICQLAHDKGFETDPLTIYRYVECIAMIDNFLAVDPTGDVYKCIAACNFPEHRVGTLNEDGELINMNHQVYCTWVLRNPLLFEECRTCKFSPICGSGCALAAYCDTGDLNSPSCKEKDMGEVVRTYVKVNYPQLFERCTYETIIL
jgi:uncharacterized protein